MKKQFVMFTDPKSTGYSILQEDHIGRHWAQSKVRGREVNCKESLYCGFHGKELMRQGKQV